MNGSLTDLELQTVAQIETNTVGDTNVAALVPLWWKQYDGKLQIVKFWYVKRAIFDYLLGQSRRLRQVKIGNDTFMSNQVVANLKEMRKLCQDELDGLDPQRVGILDSVDGISTLPDAFDEDVDRTNIIGAEPAIWTRP